MSLIFSPLVENFYIYALLALMLIALLLFLRPQGYGWRIGALLSLLLVLFNPNLKNELREKLPTTVAIVVDKSASQTLLTREKQTDDAVAKLVSRLKELNFETRIIDAKDNKGTNLFAALKNGLSDLSPTKLGGVVMVSDGQVHDVPEKLDLNVPFHALITGEKNDKDRRLVLESAPRFGIVGQEVQIVLKVIDAPNNLGTARITINRDNEPAFVRNVTLSQPITLRLPITKAGENLLDISVNEVEGELTPINNRLAISIEGVREKLRVLLVSGAPHAGERTWRNLLKSDPTIELVHFTILRSQTKAQFDSTPQNELALIAFPTRDLFVNKLNEFDLIIFDRYAQLGLIPTLYYDNIANYVQNGGALLVAAGPEFARENSLSLTPLDAVLPAQPVAVNTAPFSVKQTPDGLKHPVTRALKLEKTAPWQRSIKVEEVRGSSVLSANNAPLLLLSREKKGRVALLLSDHIWLWARGVENGGPHQELLKRLSHWLMKEPELEEENLRLSSNNGDLMVTQQTLKDQALPVTLTSPSNKTTALSLEKQEAGLYRALMPQVELGLWKATNGIETRLHMVGAQNPKEWAQVVSTTEVLQPISKATGGGVWRVADFPRLVAMENSNVMSGSDWAGFKEQSVTRLTSLSLTPFLLGFIGLIGLLLMLARTWWRESK